MQPLVPKTLPRYECLVEASKRFPDLDPSACEAFMHLLRSSDDVLHVMHDHFARHETTQGRFMVLMQLIDKGTDCPRARTPAELADRVTVSRATITGLLDSLERDGFVRREPDPEDRRQMSVHITPAGEAFLQGMLPDHFRLITRLMSALSVNEQKTLVRLVDKIAARAAECLPAAVAPTA